MYPRGQASVPPGPGMRLEQKMFGRRPEILIGAPRTPEQEVAQQFAEMTILSPHSYQTMASGNTETLLMSPRVYQQQQQQRIFSHSGRLFNALEDGIVLKILAWLDTAELLAISKVCKRFETLVWSSPQCWRSIHLKGEHIRGDKMLKMIFKRLLNSGQLIQPSLSFVERVYASGGCKLSDKSLGMLSRRCPELTHLQVHNSEVTNYGVEEVLYKCTNLQHLDLTGCLQVANILSGHELTQRRFLLQYLDLTDCVTIDDYCLLDIVRFCPNLVYLYLRRCAQITDEGLKCIANYCRILRELSISDCTQVSDFGLYELAKLGPQLRYLSVAKCNQVTDSGLKMIARRCHKMRYLNTRSCEAVSDEAIMWLARSCPRLRAIDIGSCSVSDTGLKVLAEGCPNLKKLSLRSCDMISDNGLNYIAYYCRGLQHLNIQDCPISSEGYRYMRMYCKRCVIEHTNPGFG